MLGWVCDATVYPGWEADGDAIMSVDTPLSSAAGMSVNTLIAGSDTDGEEVNQPSEQLLKGDSQVLKLLNTLTMSESDLTVDQLVSLKTLIAEYSVVFALDMSELGLTDLVSLTINTGDNPPIRQPVRRTPFALHEKMEELIQNMMVQGVIQHSSSPWANLVVLVEKRDGSYRFCVDYRHLNAVTKMDVFPLPHVDDTLDMLLQTRYFTLDLAPRYLQVQMDNDSQENTAFSTYSGHYEFRVMPFRLCNASATFQRLMDGDCIGRINKELFSSLFR